MEAPQAAFNRSPARYLPANVRVHLRFWFCAHSRQCASVQPMCLRREQQCGGNRSQGELQAGLAEERNLG
jgi:hypothetical protein